MIALAGTLLLAASLAAPAAQRAGAAEPRLTLLDVPYLSQSEALCGGAAAAMVLRYWGARATAEDFAPLVDRTAGGIATAVLTRAVQERGWVAIAASGRAPLAQAELAAGRPVIALIEDRPGTFHYVVVVGWHDRAVVLHDPARTPYVLMQPADFERRWEASGRWMLAVAPSAASRLPGAESQPSGAGAGAGGSAGSCEALVAAGVAHAQKKELGEAERLLAGAAYRCPGAAPIRELAGLRVLQRRWSEVAELASRAVAIDAADAHAWRLLAASRYVTGDRTGALAAWNEAGEPVVDLVTVSGLQRTSHRILERRLAIPTGAVLTPGRLARAERRLQELPAAFATRVEYVARGGGRAEVRGHVAERRVIPMGRLSWAGIGLRAAAAREVAIAIAGLAGGGERVDARWRFWPHRPGAAAALHVPAAAGLFSFEVSGERQPFTTESRPDAERVGAQASLGDWATGSLRWELRGGVDRWTTDGSFGMAGGEVRALRGGVELTLAVDGWIGGSRFAVGRARADWESSPAPRGFVATASAGLEWIQGPAPMDVWRAGDTGHARAVLLRAHPVLDDGALRVDRLGRRLVHATSEAQYWFRAGPLPLGAALFVDTARTAARLAGGPLADVDAGAGMRLALPGRSGAIRIDIAHGLRDGRNAVSVAWTP